MTADADTVFAPLALLDRRAQSLGCARCGACCEKIVLSFDPRVSALRPDDPDDPINTANARFYPAHWTVEWTDSGEHGPEHVVTCNAYDAEHRACTLGDARPPICRGYPHYDRVPVTGTVLDRKPLPNGASCSYYLDVPGWAGRGLRPLLPVEVLRG